MEKVASDKIQKDPAFTEKLISKDLQKDSISPPTKPAGESAGEGGNQDIVADSR